MGDITSAISGLGDSIGNLFSDAGQSVTDAAAVSPTSIAPTAGTDAASFGEFGADSVTPATVGGTFGDISGLSDVVNQMPAVSDPSLSFTAGVQPDQTSPLFMGTATSAPTAAPSGVGATLPMDTVPPTPPTAVPPGPLPTGVALTSNVTPAAGVTGATGGAGGGGGDTPLAIAPPGALSGDDPLGSQSGAVGGSNPLGGQSQGGVLDWLSKQLTGPGSLKNDISMLAALGGLGMSAFKPNALPGAGQTLTPSGTSTGQSVANAQQQQQLAAQEAATQAEQQKLAQGQEAISASQQANAAPLMATGQQQVAAAASGQLLPAQQAQVAAALAANQQQIRAKYANLGLSGSTMEQSDLNQANLQSQALIASLLNQNQTQGLTTVTGAESLLAGGGTSLAGASGDINSAVTALNNSVSALGNSSNTYMAILQQQLAQDQELQKALGQMAQSLGTSTALTNLGNTAGTAGATAA